MLPLCPSPTYNVTAHQRGLSHPGEYLRPHPFTNRCTETKKNGPDERTDQNSRKELSNEEIDNLSDVEFKTMVIRMLTELVECGHKLDEKMKAILSE